MSVRFLVAGIAMLAATIAIRAQADDEPVVSVREIGGAYFVDARFSVSERESIVREVLTDYANIPRFMPNVRTSEILERDEGYARVEQEAVSKFLLFSKRVHLVLDIDDSTGVIRFRDRCAKSFARYEGAWTLREHKGGTEITYELEAQPAFSTPEFVLRKLVKRDARVMIERLRAEIGARAATPESSQDRASARQ